MSKVLYIGSGNSAKLVDTIDTSCYYIVCANNAWKLFKNSKFDAWIHSGDFPYENRPKKDDINYKLEVSHKEYSLSAENICKKLQISTKSPCHILGYTIFFLGLYWILDNRPNSDIYLLGFDHDYNSKKIQKWNSNNRPNPQNKYLKPKNQSIAEWSDQFFSGMQKDSFYGHGTPDPMRLGLTHLKQKMQNAITNANKLGVQVVNLSPVESEFNQIIPRK